MGIESAFGQNIGWPPKQKLDLHAHFYAVVKTGIGGRIDQQVNVAGSSIVASRDCTEHPNIRGSVACGDVAHGLSFSV